MPYISRETLLEEIHRLADGENPPIRKEMNNKGNHSPRTYDRRFGSWNDAVREAGYEPNLNNNIRSEELIDEMCRLAEDHVGPTWRMMEMEGKYDPTTYKNRWGSWNEALEAAGLSQNKNTNISEGDLLNEIDRLAADGGEPPAKRDMKERGKYSVTAYRTEFGCWNDALRAAGYNAKQVQNIPAGELLEEIRRLASELGRTPTFHEMDDLGRVSTMAYRYNFDSWWVAVVRAGLVPQRRRPLSDEEIHKFHQATIAERNRNPYTALVGLLFQFTGFTIPILSEFTVDWITTPADDVIITVPPEFTDSKRPWDCKLPENWTNPHTSGVEETYLPGLVEWYFEMENRLETRSGTAIRRQVFEIASAAGLAETRGETTFDDCGIFPKVTPADLRVTHGIHLARNGAPEEYIEQRLGLQHTNSDIDIEDLFIWLEEHGKDL